MSILCIDNGYGDTKVKYHDLLYSFNSRIQPAMSSDGNILFYKGISYQVGTGHDDINSDKSDSLTHKLCLLRSISENLNDCEEVHIMLDLPLTHYYNLNYRNELSEFLEQNDSIIYNGKQKKIKIKQIDIYPQGLVALYANDITSYSDKIIGILDFGALTVDGVIVDNLKPIKESMFSVNLGTKILENKIKTYLNQEFLLNLQDYHIPYIIKDGGIDSIPESQKIISKVIEEHLEILKREMMGLNWSLEMLNILGVGGGSILLKDYLEIYFNHKLSNNPVFDNVLGLYTIGKTL